MGNTPALNDPNQNDDSEFWKAIEQIEGLSIQIGLERVSGRRIIYEKSLRIMPKEIEKCIKKLTDFFDASDMNNFSIVVHSIKSTLANIGSMELSAKALDLENASSGGDLAYCANNMPSLLSGLNKLYSALQEAYTLKEKSNDPIVIPPELPDILEKMITAFDKMDFILIDKLTEKIDALNTKGALKEELEQIKDAALTMDYENAKEIITKLRLI